MSISPNYSYQKWNHEKTSKQVNSEILFSIQEVGSPINAFLVPTNMVVPSFNIEQLKAKFREDKFFENHDVSEILRGDYSRLAFDIDAKTITLEEFNHLVNQLTEMLEVLHIPPTNLNGIMECINPKISNSNSSKSKSSKSISKSKSTKSTSNSSSSESLDEENSNELEEVDMRKVLNEKFGNIHHVERKYFTNKSQNLAIINFLIPKVEEAFSKDNNLKEIFEEFLDINFNNTRKTDDEKYKKALFNFTVFIYSFNPTIKKKWYFEKMLIVDNVDKYKAAKKHVLETYNDIHSYAEKIINQYLSLPKDFKIKINQEAELFALQHAKALSLHLYVKGFIFNRNDLYDIFHGHFMKKGESERYLDGTIDTSIYVHAGSQKCMRFGLSGKMSETRPAPTIQ